MAPDLRKKKNTANKVGNVNQYVSPYAQQRATSGTSDVNTPLSSLRNSSCPVTKEELNDALSVHFDRLSNLFNTSLAEINKNFDKINEDINEVKKRIDKLENYKAGNCNDVITASNLACEELLDRNRQAHNITLHGLIASRDGISDLDLYHQLLADAPNLPRAVSATRIGSINANNNKPRPIKLCFSSHDDVKTIFRNKKIFIDRNFKITNDLTILERKHLDNLRKELQSRVSKGEENITIKYVNGTPKIISLRKNA